MTGGVVQQMAAPGVETIVGVVHHPLFGPLVMFGMGGIATELLGDRSFRILPAHRPRRRRAGPLAAGLAAAVRLPRLAPVAVDALEDLLQRVARLAGDVPELAELDINPLIVSPEGAVAVDARARCSCRVPVTGARSPPDALTTHAFSCWQSRCAAHGGIRGPSRPVACAGRGPRVRRRW